MTVTDLVANLWFRSRWFISATRLKARPIYRFLHACQHHVYVCYDLLWWCYVYACFSVEGHKFFGNKITMFHLANQTSSWVFVTLICQKASRKCIRTTLDFVHCVLLWFGWIDTSPGAAPRTNRFIRGLLHSSKWQFNTISTEWIKLPLIAFFAPEYFLP